MTKAEKIRRALRLDPMDDLRYGSGVDGRGWYLRRFGASSRYLGASYSALKAWLEDTQERRKQHEREYQQRIAPDYHQLYDWVSETLAGTKILVDDVISFRKMPLPDDNWYPNADLENRPDWGESDPQLFALYDDGSGARWLPVERN